MNELNTNEEIQEDDILNNETLEDETLQDINSDTSQEVLVNINNNLNQISYISTCFFVLAVGIIAVMIVKNFFNRFF